MRGSFNGGPGFAWSELLFAVPLTAIVPAIATPSPARLNAGICTVTTGEQLPGALRLAQMMERIQVASIAVRDRVILAAPAQSCLGALGMQATEPAVAGDASNASAIPGGGHGGPTSCLVSRAEAKRQSKVDVCRPGTAEVRDAVKERVQPLSSCL